MDDHSAPSSGISQPLDELWQGWEAALRQVSKSDVAQVNQLLLQLLLNATSPEVHGTARRRLRRLAVLCEETSVMLHNLVRLVGVLQEEWLSSHRYTDFGLAALGKELNDLFAGRPEFGAKRWLREILDALEARESTAAERIADESLPFPEALQDGMESIRSGIRSWISGDSSTGLQLLETLATGAVPGWERVVDTGLRNRAHWLAAWLLLRTLGDEEGARQHLDRALALNPRDGHGYGVRAAYHLFVGDLDKAATDAQQAIELAPADPVGHLQLGIWAELSAQFDEADDLYRRGLQLLSPVGIASLTNRISLLDPPGRLLLVAAELLFAADRPQAALTTIDKALAATIRGPGSYPEAEGYRLRSVIVEQLGTSPADAASAALEAGKRYLWEKRIDEAVRQLRRSLRFDHSRQETGWLLADALVDESFPAVAAEPDFQKVAEANRTWEEWSQTTGGPGASTAWAYLTRAIIADYESFRVDGDRVTSLWEAVIYVERSLVHDRADEQRWAFSAKYLRTLGLKEVALESVERAYELTPSSYLVLSERMLLLSSRGSLAEAEAMAAEIVTISGEDPLVCGVRARLAFQQGRFVDALELLDLPLQQEYDLGSYYDLRALCHLAIGEVDAALDDYRSVVAKGVPVDGVGKCQLAIASTVLGDLPAARQWLEKARRDVMSEPSLQPFTAALVALAAGEAGDAERLLRDAVDASGNTGELRNIELMLPLLLSVLRSRYQPVEKFEQRVLTTLQDALPVQTSRLEEHGPTADSQLQDAARKHAVDASNRDLGIPGVALLAILSRRWEESDALLQAADGYQRLLATSFEPEARIGLLRVLAAANEERTAHGDVDSVMRIQDRRRALGAVDSIEAGLAVAAALEATGEVGQAREYLEGLWPEAADDVQREILHQRIGELSVFAGDIALAKEHLDRAVAIAEGRQEPIRVAQLTTRRALVEMVADPTSSPWIQALRTWRAAGAFDATRTLVEELQGFLDTPSASPWRQRALDSLRSTLKQPPVEEQLEDFGTIDTNGIYRAFESDARSGEPDR
jgi:tetratricopeptide (TPR) repeat protein